MLVIYFQKYLKFLMKWKCKQIYHFTIYHFLVESKPHERVDLVITASLNIYQTKKRKKNIPIVMKTIF